MKSFFRSPTCYGIYSTLVLVLIVSPWFESATRAQSQTEYQWEPYDESAELAAQQDHENSRMRFRLLNSKYLNKNVLWDSFEQALADFSEQRYQELKPFILEQGIPSLQRAV